MPNRFRNPSVLDLFNLVSAMPNAVRTEWGNFSVRTFVTSRLNQYTFFVSDEEFARPHISHMDYERVAAFQDNHINNHEMIQIDGSIGLENPVQVPSRLLVETTSANIAAMQSQLYFKSGKTDDPKFKIIYTPSLKPNILSIPSLIAVDLDTYTTRIFGTDYFGESKKAGLRMWNKWVYDQGGLALHAGCKTYFNSLGEERAVVIIGLSGTGKTTTTFNTHLGSQPVQDDFCALFPDGRLFASENGCFAKTFGLDETHEPVIYSALRHPDSWLENVAVGVNGRVNYLDGSYTTNGRGTFTLDKIDHRSTAKLPRVSHMIILNRNFDIIPGIALLKPKQVVEYFMLGETTGTSAGGLAEAGKFLRVPGTNPFFFANDALQGKRLNHILQKNPDIKVAIMNTGCIGGHPEESTSLKVKIAHSSALLEALLQDRIKWREDEDFGYWVVDKPIDGCPQEITCPKRYLLKIRNERVYSRKVNDLFQSRKRYLDAMIP